VIDVGPRSVLFVVMLLSAAVVDVSAQGVPLRPCPDSPNCVSTVATDSAHRMAPWPFTAAVTVTRNALEAIIRAEPRTRIVSVTDSTVHATFTSRLFRFVDDVEFHIDESARLIHFRSASRVGRSDLGVNRARMERLHRAFLSQSSP
jgi:uncharacterized protein (DUF1499 family)